jgi:hydroxymethylglutaryl-CoA synthase
MANTYDFYKPILHSEYPEVDGRLSVTSHLHALDESYTRFRQKSVLNTRSASHGQALPDVDHIDFPIFHSPYGKLVQKAYARMVRL